MRIAFLVWKRCVFEGDEGVLMQLCNGFQFFEIEQPISDSRRMELKRDPQATQPRIQRKWWRIRDYNTAMKGMMRNPFEEGFFFRVWVKEERSWIEDILFFDRVEGKRIDNCFSLFEAVQAVKPSCQFPQLSLNIRSCPSFLNGRFRFDHATQCSCIEVHSRISHVHRVKGGKR